MGLLDGLLFDPVTRPKIFVSYHHGSHRDHYLRFSEVMHDELGLVTDNSLDEPIDSEQNRYVRRAIRERYIRGTSCTVVLCGNTTYGRKFVDWEIHDSLARENALVAIAMPGIESSLLTGRRWPDRLVDNFGSGYAVAITWEEVAADPVKLRDLILHARQLPKHLIRNDRALRERDHNPDNALLGLYSPPPRR